MVADERQFGGPVDQVVIGREVVGPEETLLAQLDGVGHKVKHCHPNGHLNEHRQATAHRVDAILAVHRHHFLLLLHGVFLLGILPVDFLDLRPEHTHLGTAHETLAAWHVDDSMEQNGDQQQHNTHWQAQLGEEIEDVDRKVAVDPFEDRPAEVDKLFQFQVAVVQTVFVHALQQAVLVRPEVELEVRRFFA